jgi:hypothetical protein
MGPTGAVPRTRSLFNVIGSPVLCNA